MLWIFDSSLKLDKNDIKISEFLKNTVSNIPIIAVLNKSDLVSNHAPSWIFSQKQNNDVSGSDFCIDISISGTEKITAKTGKGIPEILDKSTKIAGTSEMQNDYLMINSRHYTLLQNVSTSLNKAREALQETDCDEIACFEAVTAQAALNEILGIDGKEDILDTIFSTFCIGK